MENETMMRSHSRATRTARTFALAAHDVRMRETVHQQMSWLAHLPSNFQTSVTMFVTHSRHPFSCCSNSFFHLKNEYKRPSNTSAIMPFMHVRNAPFKPTCASSFNNRYAHHWSCLPAQRLTSCICDYMQECMVGVHLII